MVRQRYQLFPSSYIMIKDLYIWLAQKHTWPHPTKSDSLICYLLLMIITMQKINDINWVSPVLLLIKESFHLIG